MPEPEGDPAVWTVDVVEGEDEAGDVPPEVNGDDEGSMAVPPF